MNLYHIVLFLHICALLAAISAGALVHFAEIRMRAGRTIGEVRPWVMLAGSVDKTFPLALLTLVATGAYMVSAAWAWNDGWVDTAIGGVVLLFITGGFLSSRGKALGRALGGDPHEFLSAATARMVCDPITRSVSCANTALAVGIVFVMVNKPSLPGALATLAVAVVTGMVVAIPLWRGGPASVSARAVLADAGAREPAL